MPSTCDAAGSTACNNADTRLWSEKCDWNWMKCDWNWMRSGQACKSVFPDDEIDKGDFFKYPKCFSE